MSNLTEAERVLHVLADGAWHTTTEIRRRAAIHTVGERVKKLRVTGAKIDSERIPRSHHFRYQWRNIPANLRLAVEDGPQPMVGEVPRTQATRFRIYVVPRFGEQLLMDTAATEEEVGRKIVALGNQGQLDGCCLGLLDTRGIAKEVFPGKWLLNPHEGRW